MFLAQFEADASLTMHGLTVHNFFDIGMANLKSKTAILTLGDDIFYFFNHPLQSPACHTPDAWKLLSQVAGSGALAASDTLWLQPSTSSHFDSSCLTSWKDLGLIHDVHPRRWKITSAGQSVLTTCRCATQPLSMFKRWKRDQLMSYTHWQLLDLLLCGKWVLAACSKHQKTEAVEVTEAGAPPGTFYFQPKGMKIG